jgi:hypothetical protein
MERLYVNRSVQFGLPSGGSSRLRFVRARSVRLARRSPSVPDEDTGDCPQRCVGPYSPCPCTGLTPNCSTEWRGT